MLTAVAAIVMLGLLIFVHELGHFLAFKLTGVKVLKFSLGFDPVLFKRQIGETSYQLGAIPIGGYVRPLGEQDYDEIAPEDRGRALGDKPLWARAFAFFAGPAMNLVFPVFLFWLVYSLPGEEISNRVGMTLPGRPAAAAGILPGDRITAVDGVPIQYWTDVQDAVSSRPGKTFPVEVDRHGARQVFTVTAEPSKELNRLGEEQIHGRVGILSSVFDARVAVPLDDSPAAKAGLKSWDLVRAVNGKKVRDWLELRDAFEAAGRGAVTLTVARRDDAEIKIDKKGRKDRSAAKVTELTVTVDSPGTAAGAGIDTANSYVRDVEPGTPAETAGIKPGDRIVAIDGRPAPYWGSLEEHFRRDPEKVFELTLARGAATVTAAVKLLKRTERDEMKQEVIYYDLGARNDASFADGETVGRPLTPGRGLRESLNMTAEIIRTTYVAVYRLATGKLSLKTVGGPIMIFGMAGAVVEKGALPYLWFMGLISINLGIMNLLPVPILDGGHLMLAAIEAVRRKPLSLRARVIANYAGLTLLAALFILVFKNDIERYWDSIAGFFARLLTIFGGSSK